MLIPHAPAPSKVLTEIQMMLVAQLVESPLPGPVTIDRRHVVILQAALGEVAGQMEVLEESAAAADRLAEELRIVTADRERWRRAAETYRAAWAKEVGGSNPPPTRAAPDLGLRLTPRGAVIVDLTEVMRREHREAGRPTGPEGGAA